MNILKQLFGKVVIPREVFREVVEQGKGKPGEKEVEKADWIEVARVTDQDLIKHYYERPLTLEDATIVALAREKNADLVIADDDELRKAIQKENLAVIGTIGILLQAKREGLIPNVGHVLERLIREGLRISEKVYRDALKEAGE